MGLSLLIAVESAEGKGPPAWDNLNYALTTEGLIFAAFAVAIRLAAPTSGGRSPFFTQAWFGWLFVLAIAAAAISAGASWWAAYEPSELAGSGAWLRAGGLVPGIIGPPVFAAIINWQARNQ